MQNDKIKIDIVSDVACPWCYVGKKRLEKAIKQWHGIPIEIEWHPFQLDPNIPKEGLDRDTYLTNKFGSLEGPLEMTKRLEESGKEEGITFHLNSIEVLSSIMAEYDWSAEKTKQVLEDDSIAYAVKQEIAHYQQRGVNSVPFFIINDKYGISGAQPASVFLEAFQQVSPLKIISEGNSCDPVTGVC